MLSKLLKRCMPWMDKGRWYKIVLEPDANNNTFIIGAGTDPAFRDVRTHYEELTNGDVCITLDNTGFSIVDAKIRFFFDDSISGYISAIISSYPYGTSIIMHGHIAFRPSDGCSFEITAFCR